MASRTIGSPQIRNRGTVGGNLGTASPAGDAHPPLLAARAIVELESVTGPRLVPIDDFFVGPKRSVLGPDELIRAVRIPVADGPQQFSKIGPRNAMVIATTSFALCVDRGDRRIGTGIGSAGPTPLRAERAEALVAEAVDGVGRPGPTRPRRWPAASVTSWRPRPARSTTCGARRATGATRSPCWRGVASGGSGSRSTGRADEAPHDGQRSRPRGRRRLGGREPAVRAARAARAARVEERLRAGRVRFVLRPDGRRPRVRLPGGRRPGGRRVDRHHRGARRRGRPPSRAAGVPRRRRGAVRVLHARADRRRARAVAAPARTRRGDRPGGTGRQPLPVHGLPEDPRRGAAGRTGGNGA